MDKPIYRLLKKDPGLITVLKEALDDAFTECYRQNRLHGFRCHINNKNKNALFPKIANFGKNKF